MPTRSGLDFHEINPNYFVCAYCYMAYLDVPGVLKLSGMQCKRATVRVDEEVNDFTTLPYFTRVWTEPHCPTCNRRIKGYPVSYRQTVRHKYA